MEGRLTTIRSRRVSPRRALPDLRAAEAEGLRGLPALDDARCLEGCRACLDVCPTQAITRTDDAIRLDLGRCVFCHECAGVCPASRLTFTPDHRLASGSRAGLVLGPERRRPEPAATSAALRRLYGRSLKLWRAAAGGCDGCDSELRACADAHFEMGRWGIDWVASPRDADGLVLSGHITPPGSEPLRRAWTAIRGPKMLIAVGACAISGGLYHDAPTAERGFFDEFTPDLFLAGCPVHPLTFINGVLDLLGIT